MKMDDEPQVSQAAAAAAARVEMIVMDVDGVLTDGSTCQMDNGEQFLRFSVRDGTGLVLCGLAGIELAVISGREVPAARIRMERFSVSEMHFGCKNKLSVLEGLCSRRGLSTEQVAYLGDDLNDLPLLAAVGLPVAVADAVAEVRAAAVYCTRRNGGQGAVREVIELVLRARGLYDKAVEEYLKQH